jgi:quinol monooxygenase YgiN
MFGPIVYVDRSEIREGRFEELKVAMKALVELIETNEPRLIAYNVYVTPDGTHMTVIHVHHDSDSLEFHMKVGGPEFPRFASYVNLLAIDVFGQPSAGLLEQLRQKAALLGSGTVRVHELQAGFSRFHDSR